MANNPRFTDWTGQVVWIIGGSTGIGRATAARLHAAGAHVVVSARSAAPLATFEHEHPGSLGLVADVTDAAGLRSATDTLLATYGRLDLVFICSGHYRPQRATAFDLAEALRHQHINYVGVLYVLDAVLPVLLRQGRGHISLAGSVSGYRGLPQALAYGPTKAALINLAEVLHLDLSAAGIGVSIVNPGFVDTPLTAQNAYAMPGLMSPEAAAQRIEAGWAAGRFEIHFPRRLSWVLKCLRWWPDRLYFALVHRATGL
jgi:NAD(P)-dependent dehydrogenase (short-subunit alcohol dehydrogenase family)